MPSELPSLQLRRFRELGLILADTVQRDGERILLELLKRRTRDNAEKRSRLPLTTTIAHRVKGMVEKSRERGWKEISRGSLATIERATWEGWKQARRLPRRLQAGLRHLQAGEPKPPSSRGEGMLMGIISSASYLGGLAMGFQAPALDLKLTRKGSGESAIVVHSAPLFSLEVTLEWMSEILRHARLHPQLSPEDKQGLVRAEELMASLSQGVATGAAARVRAGSRDPATPPTGGEEVEIPLDEQMIAALGRFFSFLSELGRRG
jgi:hypothetical protein